MKRNQWTGYVLMGVILASAVCLTADAASLQTFTWDKSDWVAFDDTITATVDCPDPAAAEWVKDHFTGWYGAHAPRVSAGKTGLTVQPGDEAYAAEVDGKGVRIAARTLAGTRWAAYTLRQIAIAKR
ncbi:MAG: hypothetical protein J6334_09145, partial [Kiritimatiellae bacterium]|nr:hypothetical protein [Kiritimatiellia bacterium]